MHLGNLHDTKKQIEDNAVGQVDQSMMPFKLYLTNICKTRNVAQEVVQILPIPFHEPSDLPLLSQKASNLFRNTDLDHLQLLRLKNKQTNKQSKGSF